MKIAKKALAIVMAIAMIACLTAMAFAAPTTKFVLKADKPDEDGVVAVYLYAVDAVGFKSGKAFVTYNTELLTYSYAELGADATKVNSELKAAMNTYTGLDNEETAGTVSYAFYFLDKLCDKAGFDAQAKKKQTINSDNFECAVFFFELNEGVDPDQLVFSLDKVEGDGEGASYESATVKVKEEPAAPEKESEQEKETEVKPTDKANEEEEKTTKAGNPDTGDKNTGDNMALVAAASVVALAGAAFIVSKKRK